MGALAITMFAGITALAIAAHVHMGEDRERPDRPSSRRGAEDGAEPARPRRLRRQRAFYLLQGFTAAILVLAANTAFNGFPVLASLLGRDNYMPHQLANRGDRLVFSNGIVLLAVVAALLIVAFDANVTRLIQLYILGVFLSFTLSQAGMVRHWARPAGRAPEPRNARATPQAARQRRSAVVSTAVVFVIVLVTKFAQGAWIVVVAAPIIFATMKASAGTTPGSAISSRRPPPVWRCRGASMASSWSRTCWRRLCGRSPSPRRRTPATLRAVTVAADDADDRLAGAVAASAVCRCRSW